MRRIVTIYACVMLAVTALPAAPGRAAALVLEDERPATHRTARAGVRAIGGRVVHDFADLLIVDLPAGSELAAYRLRGVRQVVLAGAASTPRGAGASPGLAAWAAIASGGWRGDRGPLPGGPLDDDALAPPAVNLDAVLAAGRKLKDGGGVAPDAGTTGGPFGATAANTSEFLAGSVSLNVILVESDGSHEISTENWSSAREAEVVSRIALGAEWDRLQEPQAEVSFVYHVFTGRTDARARTGYEPIRHPADPSGLTGEDLWVKEILSKLGYASGDRFARVRALDADTRRADGTDWAVTVFVVDSLVDIDGKFADGRFAYSWIGGPHLVMTYDNGAWGSGRIDMVLRHELLHSFYAFDEYQASGCNCTDHRGYLDAVNLNCEVCNPLAASCVMISNDDAMCDATRRSVGWADLDGDGVIDVVGEDPDTVLDPLAAEQCAAPVLSGLATVVAAHDRNTFGVTPAVDISVNRIVGVEVRADGGAWSPADPEGSAWGAPQVRFAASVSGLAPGAHRLEARAIDDHGNSDGTPAAAEVLVASGAAAEGSGVRADRSDGAIALTWEACAGASFYRIYRRTTPGGDAILVGESDGTAFTDGAGGSGYYDVRPVDACGDERSD
jgi:hypothetical protein